MCPISGPAAPPLLAVAAVAVQTLRSILELPRRLTDASKADPQTGGTSMDQSEIDINPL